MVRFRGVGAVLVLSTALAGCGGLDAEDEKALKTCHEEVRGHLKDAGAERISFGETEVDDEEEGNWVVSGPVRTTKASGDYRCRVVDSELDKVSDKRIADVVIAPALLRE